MSNKKNESVADVVKDIRERLDHAAEERDFGIIEPDEMYGWADRLEAAAKRERGIPGEKLPCRFTDPETDCAWRTKRGKCLSPCVNRKPLRNCDRFRDENSAMAGYERSPVDDMLFVDWLFAPAEESEVAK